MIQNSMKAFFKEVAASKDLQQQLYHTREISDVAQIAREQGFDVSSEEILKAQTGRLIELSVHHPAEAKIATSGKKPNMGAQWGREGNGFLEKPGYWLVELFNWGIEVSTVNADLRQFIAQLDENNSLVSQISTCENIDALSEIALENGFKISPITFLVYLALSILSLDSKKAEIVAQGKQ